jgi:hypothetical protein
MARYSEDLRDHSSDVAAPTGTSLPRFGLPPDARSSIEWRASPHPSAIGYPSKPSAAPPKRSSASGKSRSIADAATACASSRGGRHHGLRAGWRALAHQPLNPQSFILGNDQRPATHPNIKVPLAAQAQAAEFCHRRRPHDRYVPPAGRSSRFRSPSPHRNGYSTNRLRRASVCASPSPYGLAAWRRPVSASMNESSRRSNCCRRRRGTPLQTEHGRRGGAFAQRRARA